MTGSKDCLGMAAKIARAVAKEGLKPVLQQKQAEKNAAPLHCLCAFMGVEPGRSRASDCVMHCLKQQVLPRKDRAIADVPLMKATKS